MRKTKIDLLSIAWVLGIILLMTGCGSGNGSAEYKGVNYDGEGKTKTMVDVAILNEDEILFLQQVKIIDDHPTVWKALEAISMNEKEEINIEKDQEGHFSKINNQQNDEQRQWILQIDNIPEEGNVEDIQLSDGQGITLSYHAK
jgi:hypothetical protein